MPKQGHIGARLTAHGLAIEFVWQGDRFVHTISVGPTTLASIELESFETPVFQEVHQQGDLVFASGMSGDRHWSASVEPSEEGLLFDLACRVKTLPSIPFGSAYTRWDTAGLQVIGRPAGSSPPPKLETLAEAFTIAAAIDDVPLPTTLRYRYAIVVPDPNWIEQDQA